MEARDSDPAMMLGELRQGSASIRHDFLHRGAVPEILTKRNRHVRPSVSRPLHALCSRIECSTNRLKSSRRIANRCDQTADSVRIFAAMSSMQLGTGLST